MKSRRAALGFRIGFSLGAAVLVLAGATLNAEGRQELGLILGGAAGLLAVGAGLMFQRWRVAAPVAVASAILAVAVAQLDPRQADPAVQAPGLLLLAIGGVLGGIAYRSFLGEESRLQAAQQRLTTSLEEKHRAFVSATSDIDSLQPGDLTAITATMARDVGADFACSYLASADGRRYVPQPPGVAVERLRPQAVNRPHGNAGPLLAAIEARSPFVAEDENALGELINHLPDDFHLASIVAVPLPVGEHVGGFIVLGRSSGQFSDDDARLAATLAARAGSRLASAQLVALTRHESAR